jgi:hypothetical protein
MSPISVCQLELSLFHMTGFSFGAYLIHLDICLPVENRRKMSRLLMLTEAPRRHLLGCC